MTRKIERPRKFRCMFGICRRKFGSDSDRQRHERIHTGEKPFLCHICYKGFPQRTGLKTHLNIHTGLKPHHCIYCDQAFADPSSKARHEKETHRCVGTYKCPSPDCPVGIKRRSAFVVHLKDKHNLDRNMVDIDACAPPLLPKAPRKDGVQKKTVLGSSSNVSAKPGAHRISSSTRPLPVQPSQPMTLPRSRMHNISRGFSSKCDSTEDKDQRWFEEQPNIKGESENWDLQGVSHTFGYGDHELMYAPPPSYPAATSGMAEAPHYFSYNGQYSGMPEDGYSLQSSPRDTTPPYATISSSEPRYHLSTRVMMPVPQLIPMVGSRPLSPTLGMHLSYFDQTLEPYHHKGNLGFSGYENAPGVHGIHI